MKSSTVTLGQALFSSNGDSKSNILNALCIDVDDICESLRELGMPLKMDGYTVIKETSDLLEELDDLGIKATFFIPGSLVRGAPDVVKAVDKAGHDIASHGDRHFAVYKLSRPTFLEDLKNSKKILEDITGKEVDTYKAPVWSINSSCLWAFDALAEAGYKIDHSVMPHVKKDLGVDPAELLPFKHSSGVYIIPATSLKLGGKAFSFNGGLRSAYLPLSLQAKMYKKINSFGFPFNFFFHPYEHSPVPENKKLYKQDSLFVSIYGAHNGIYKKILRELSKQFSFGTLKNSYGSYFSD